MKPDRLNLIDSTTLSDEELQSGFVAAFGMSSKDFERELEAEYEQASPEERAEFDSLVEKANAALPEINASLDRMIEKISEMKATMGELKESMASLDERLSRIESKIGSAFHGKPLPFRGGVGVGTVRKSRCSERLTVPTPGTSPEGEGRS